jgi:hypothetical protein
MFSSRMNWAGFRYELDDTHETARIVSQISEGFSLEPFVYQNGRKFRVTEIRSKVKAEVHHITIPDYVQLIGGFGFHESSTLHSVLIGSDDEDERIDPRSPFAGSPTLRLVKFGFDSELSEIRGFQISSLISWSLPRLLRWLGCPPASRLRRVSGFKGCDFQELAIPELVCV